MNIIINEIPVPFSHSFTLFAKFPKEKFLNEKKLRITAAQETKTRVHTSISIGEYSAAVNWDINGYKTIEKQKGNFVTFDLVTANYFVVSKKQSRQQYFEYIKELVILFLSQQDVFTEEIVLSDVEIEFVDRFKNWK